MPADDTPHGAGPEPSSKWRLVPTDGERDDAPPRAAAPRAVCLAGPSDAGKTSLVEALLPRLTEEHRVATVKSIHHDVEPDTPGTDTYRHRKAGAEAVVGITPSLTFEVAEGGKGDAPANRPSTEHGALYRTLVRLWSRGYDVILIEGFASTPLPTILVGDVDRTTTDGVVVGTDDDDLEDLVAAIRALDPLEVPATELGNRPPIDRTGDGSPDRRAGTHER